MTRAAAASENDARLAVMQRALWVCSVLVAIVVWSDCRAQSVTMTSGAGPLYSVEAVRKFELFGVHLGMRRDEVHRVMKAAGLKERGLRDPSGMGLSEEYLRPIEGRPRSVGYIGVQYKRWPRRARLVSSVSYIEFDHEPGASAIESRRAHLLERFGPPSSWTRQQASDGGWFTAAYVPVEPLVDRQTLQDAKFCVVGWACEDGQKRIECRSKMQSIRVPVFEVSLLPGFDDYSIVDYGIEVELLSREKSFRSPHPVIMCPVPRVH